MHKLVVVMGIWMIPYFVSVQSSAAAEWSVLLFSWAESNSSGYAIPLQPFLVGKFNNPGECATAAANVKPPPTAKGLIAFAMCVKSAD
jgi:hypothetical protein